MSENLNWFWRLPEKQWAEEENICSDETEQAQIQRHDNILN